jgi:hypothetical protein
MVGEGLLRESVGGPIRELPARFGSWSEVQAFWTVLD